MEKVFESEYRFLCILWETEPINSTELVRLCREKLGWKKSTTYTVIHKLSEKHIVKNEKATVTTLVSKEEVDRQESEELLQRTSKGNVPDFLATFLKDRKLTREDVQKIMRIIEEADEKS